jgi:hypothetical protein
MNCHLCGKPIPEECVYPHVAWTDGVNEYCSYTCRERARKRSLLATWKQTVIFYRGNRYKWLMHLVNERTERAQRNSRDIISEEDWNIIYSHIKLCKLCEPGPECERCPRGKHRVIY